MSEVRMATEDFDNLINKVELLNIENQKLKRDFDALNKDWDKMSSQLSEARAKNEKYRNHIKTHDGLNECPACSEEYYNQPDFETFHHVEIERDKLRAANAELVEALNTIRNECNDLNDINIEDLIKNIDTNAEEALEAWQAFKGEL